MELTTGNANGGVDKTPGSAHSSAGNADGAFTADDVNRARQEGVQMGLGKGRSQVERDLPAKIRKEVLTELGFESDEDVQQFIKSREQGVSKANDVEKQLKSYQGKLKDYEQKLAESNGVVEQWHKRWLGEYTGRIGVAIAHRVNLKEEYEDDLSRLLRDSLRLPEGEESTMRFVYEKEDVDLAATGSIDKIASYLLKRKPGWVKPVPGMQSSGYAPARQPGPVGGEIERPETTEEFVRRNMAEMRGAKFGR